MYDLLSILKNNFILCRIDWTAIFTALILIVAWTQLRKMNKTSNAEFMLKLKTDLFNEKTSLLFSTIQIKCLKYITPKKGGVSYFEIEADRIEDLKIKNEIIRKIKNLRDGSYIVDSVELDELLLGHIEDLGILYKKKILDIEMIYEEFFYNIEKCWENQDIKNYIKHVRQTEGWDTYYELENIFNKCKAYAIKKERKRF
jgi:hypothetical protein